jgi:hypothetical protein
VIRSLFVAILAAISIGVLSTQGSASQSSAGAGSGNSAQSSSPRQSASSTRPDSASRPGSASQPDSAQPGDSSGPGSSPGAANSPGVIAAGLNIQLSPAALSAAAGRCAAWASRAGFADNGYVGGNMVTAIAVALGESGCNPAACFDDTTGRECTPAGTSGSSDSIDRGVWQINSAAWKNVSNSCAYRGLCNARVAYAQVSADGTYFGPWTVYRTDTFARYLWAAQQAVNALRTGTITSALIGSCAAYPADRQGTEVQLANCGSGAADQQWKTSASTLRTGQGLCLGATSTKAGPVTVQSCNGSRLQNWQHHAGSALYNPGARLCLTDPGSSLRPGKVLTDGSCTRAQNKGWFKP